MEHLALHCCCANRTQQMRSLWIVLTSALGTWWMFLYLLARHLSCCFEGTVARDTHITLLESDSSLSVHLSSDFMWLGAWCHMTAHSFPAIFSKSTLTRSTRVRLLPVREQLGCRLPGREDPYISHSHEQGCNLLLPGHIVSLWPLSGMSDNLCCISRKYWHHSVTCMCPREDLLIQLGCLWEVSNASYMRL